jgi:hypothetical protein
MERIIKLAIILLAICCTYIIVPPSFAAEQDDEWANIPVEKAVTQIGKYAITTQSQTAMWKNGESYSFQVRTLPTEESQILNNIYVYFNGAAVKLNIQADSSKSFTIMGTSFKIEDERDALFVSMGLTIPRGVSLDFNNPEVEAFVATVYDTNNDCKLSKVEIEVGNKKFGNYSSAFITTNISADGDYHLLRLTDRPEAIQKFKVN